MNIHDVLQRLENVKAASGGFGARCPAHEDKNNSLRVSEGEKKVVLCCYVGCHIDDIYRALKINKSDLYYDKKGNNGMPQDPILCFEIKNTEGKTIALRYRKGSGANKVLWWTQPDGKPKLGDIKTADLPLFGSEHIKDFDRSKWVEVCEGELKTQALQNIGAQALGTSTGAGSCPSVDVLESLRGFKVRLWPDNDDSGRAHQSKIAQRLQKIAAKVVTLDTSSLPHKGDAVEWIEAQLKAGNTRERLKICLQDEFLAELPGLPLVGAKNAKPQKVQAPKEEPEETEAPTPQNGRPEIIVNGKQMSALISESWDAVIQSNNPPTCFRRASKLVHIVTEQGASPLVEELGESGFRGILARSANWYKENQNGTQPVFPPKEIAQDALVFSDRRLPLLKSVVSCPVFSPDGTLCATEGYHAGAQSFITFGGEKIALNIRPTKEAAQEGAKFILEELIGDFAFATEADRAHALGAFLTPLCRNLTSVTPLHDFSSPVQGSGKGLLVQTIAIVTLGKQVAGQRLPGDEEEIGKTLLSELSTARPIILLDNTDATGRSAIDSASLEGVLTAEEWTGRRLGKIGMFPPMPNRALWCITGVNLEFAKGLMRRRVRVRIDPHREEPWKRAESEFKRPGDALLTFAKENRSLILSHLFSMAVYYLSLKEKPQVKTLGSFDSWSRIVGGIVTAAGVSGWLGYQDDPEEAGVESGLNDWPEFIAAWLNEFGDYPQPVAKLNELADKNQLLCTVRGDKSRKSEEIRLGGDLKKMRGRVISGQRITPEANKHSKTTIYRLLPVISSKTEQIPAPATFVAPMPVSFTMPIKPVQAPPYSYADDEESAF